VTLDLAEDLGAIRADSRKVKQIVYNLLSNAVKFSSEGARVELRAERDTRDRAGHPSGIWRGRGFPVLAGGVNEFLKISVGDTGIGISPEGMEQLFKPFSQIDSGLARKFEGTGLGLAMVKLLAELHGGAVAVESAVGEGSRFSIWLPFQLVAEDAPELPMVAPPQTIERREGPRTAMVVEDDVRSAELIRVQLEAEGFTVLHARSGEQALAMALEQPLSLITLDIMLPSMDGWELLAQLKQLPDLARIPVVIISIVADRNQGFSLGAAAVMQKPISRLELCEALSDLGLFPRRHDSTLSVLIADDDPNALELIEVRLAGLANTVWKASGGQEAIEIALRELPDLIVLDLMMPGVNGFDVVAALQRSPATAHIPILVVTAKGITADDRSRLNGYVVAVLEKAEFDRDRFIDEVRRAMAGRAVGVP
jgi:CheY-like chemotaxis protein